VNAYLGIFVPGLPVYGLTLPLVLQLFHLLRSGAERRCGETYVPRRVMWPRTPTLPPMRPLLRAQTCVCGERRSRI